MNEQMYIIIGMTDVGGYIEAFTKAELEAFIADPPFTTVVTFLTEIPSMEFDEWPFNTALIIRASAFVVPQIGASGRRTVD